MKLVELTDGVYVDPLAVVAIVAMPATKAVGGMASVPNRVNVHWKPSDMSESFVETVACESDDAARQLAAELRKIVHAAWQRRGTESRGEA